MVDKSEFEFSVLSRCFTPQMPNNIKESMQFNNMEMHQRMVKNQKIENESTDFVVLEEEKIDETPAFE